MTNYTATKCGALIGIEVMAAEFATSHPTDGMDEVGPVEVFEPVLIGIVGVGSAVEIIGRRIFPTLLVTCILWPNSVHVS